MPEDEVLSCTALYKPLSFGTSFVFCFLYTFSNMLYRKAYKRICSIRLLSYRNRRKASSLTASIQTLPQPVPENSISTRKKTHTHRSARRIHTNPPPIRLTNPITGSSAKASAIRIRILTRIHASRKDTRNTIAPTTRSVR